MMITLSAILIIVDCIVGLCYVITGFIDTFSTPGRGWVEIILGVGFLLNCAYILYMAQHGGN